MLTSRSLTAVLFLTGQSLADNFTISNGQIFTPGFVVLDAPQPYTPLGGDTLHVAIDVTANGKLPLSQNDGDDDTDNQIFSIEMFLYSYTTGRNFTISNGTASASNASLGEIMAQEPGSTVKHVNWISIRQRFRYQGDDYYTIFDVPISVNNSIPESDDRPSCDQLSNELLSPEDIDVEGANEVGVLFAPGDATELDINGGEGSAGSVFGPKTVVYAVSLSMFMAVFL
ncbi:uncharacterized protein FIESC28_05159 [Fusarium coffeatum]|uniref:Uncharacterized protein n=1 Tax=Fusarium coffeatum TaxID=231269 RepID=A0A366RWH1_9HYPO|nr:uncharacterized protein FIESC28_05159 [Fusarium coffeatum]RBR20806.1 hypothetical protein FIESC28_05159 [Fusarium coffeatum]